MAHVCSYPKQALKKIIMEHDRTAKEYKNYVDSNRTTLNFSYDIGEKDADECILTVVRRCESIMQGKKLQKHTNIATEWIVTYPAELCHEEVYDTGKIDKSGKHITRTYNKPNDIVQCVRFFDETYKYSSERYGKDNMLGGYVHMDETTPQIHILFVPEAISRKSGKRTVSSASLLSRSELRNYQKDLAKHMINVFGKEAKNWILNGRTKTGETIEQIKARNAADEVLNAKKNKLDIREQQLNDYEEQLNNKDIELSNMFLQTVFEVTGKQYSDDENLEDIIEDIKKWKSEMLAHEKVVEESRRQLAIEQKLHEERLSELKHKVNQQKEINRTVGRGIATDLKKYQNVADFLE